jgi:hypothetical protein
MRKGDSNTWYAPLTGIAFVIILIVSFAVGGEPPDADEPVNEIVEFYVDDKDSIQAGAALSVLAAALFVLFGGYLRKVLRAAEGEGGVLSATMFAGSIILATGAAIDATISFAISEAAEDVEPAAVQALQALWDNDFFPLALGTALFMFSAGLSIVRHGALPAWLGWIALIVGIVGLTPIGFFALPVAALWVVTVSVMLTMRARAA